MITGEAEVAGVVLVVATADERLKKSACVVAYVAIVVLEMFSRGSDLVVRRRFRAPRALR